MVSNAIIIVNYNKKELLEKCLVSIFLMEYDDFVVFVVDNGSEDGSIEMVRDKFSQVRMIKMGYNSGFCKANNVGIQKAIDMGCENVIILNNDTEVDNFFLSKLITEVDKRKSIEMVAPKILYFSNKDKIDSAGMLITSDGMATNRLLDKKSEEANDKCEVFCPTGAAALFTVDVLNDIKQDGMFFDEDYEYYFEDLDIGWRARLRGWRCVYVPDSIVYHHKNATSEAYSKFIAFYTNRNMFYNLIKNYPLIFFWRALFLSLMRYPYLLLLALFKKGTVSKFKSNMNGKDLVIVTIRGLYDVIKHSINLFNKRKYIQSRKIKTDFSEWFKKYGIGFFESK